jgi:hypothetical protein
VLPNGLKIAWGTTTGTSIWTYPITFTNAPFVTVVPQNDNVALMISSQLYTVTNTTSNSVTNYTAETGGNPTIFQTGKLYWTAIGV